MRWNIARKEADTTRSMFRANAKNQFLVAMAGVILSLHMSVQTIPVQWYLQLIATSSLHKLQTRKKVILVMILSFHHGSQIYLKNTIRSDVLCHLDTPYLQPRCACLLLRSDCHRRKQYWQWQWCLHGQLDDTRQAWELWGRGLGRLRMWLPELDNMCEFNA